LNNPKNSFAQLKPSPAKFKSCIENVGEVKPQHGYIDISAFRLFFITSVEGLTTILVPLTGSLYVPGHLSDAENMIVGVGTTSIR
jgi:prefoldin alpha subunit